ncbi:MAG: DUF5131 family protein [Spirochaetales bacterium]|nr:DUF5131 family protein [Spirochaetales bacterium]
MAKGNMYSWIDDNFNPVKGPCEYDCFYCYMNRFPGRGKLRLDENVLKSNPGTGKIVFVCSGTDLFQNAVSSGWIRKVLMKLNTCPGNKYLLQTKNPARLFDFIELIEPHMILCTTIESDMNHKVSKAPLPVVRAAALKTIKKYFPQFMTMITIEPIMQFTESFIDMLTGTHPDVINIGANSRPDVKLPEPEPGQVYRLIGQIKERLPETILHIKKNLSRIYREEECIQLRPWPGG